MGKNKAGKRDQVFQACNGGAILNSVGRKDLTNKQATFKHRPEVSEGASHEGTANARVLGYDSAQYD